MDTKHLKTFGVAAVAVLASGFLVNEFGITALAAKALPASLDEHASTVATAVVGGAVVTLALVLFRSKGK